jgi:transcriptional regulator with XRE-family HTH domain
MQVGAQSYKSFGAELRRRRLEANLSLADLEGLVYFSKSHLSKVENGLKSPSVDLARRCDEALKAGGALQALARRAPRNSTSRAPKQRAPMNDRLWPAHRSLESFGFSIPGGLDPLEAWRALYADIRRVGQTAAPATVIPLATSATESLRRIAFDLRSPLRQEALVLASRYAVYAGWMMQESGDDADAVAWTMRAVELAEAAGDAEVAAYSLVRKGLVALYGNDPAQTIHLAQRAQVLSHDPRVLGLAAQREAQGHAMAGQATASMDAVERARGHFARVEAPEHRELLVGTSTLDDPASMVEGWCLYDLGRPAAAAGVLAAQLARVPAAAQRSRCRWGSRLALSQTAIREVDAACATIEPVLQAAAMLDSATIRKDLRKLNAALSRWDDHPEVRRIVPALTAISTAQS